MIPAIQLILAILLFGLICYLISTTRSVRREWEQERTDTENSRPSINDK